MSLSLQFSFIEKIIEYLQFICVFEISLETQIVSKLFIELIFIYYQSRLSLAKF